MAKSQKEFLGTYAQTQMRNTTRGRKPDYWVKAMDKRTPGKSSSSKVGAAWKNPDGSVSVDLNPFVTLETVSRSPEDLVITLFPIERGVNIDD